MTKILTAILLCCTALATAYAQPYNRTVMTDAVGAMQPAELAKFVEQNSLAQTTALAPITLADGITGSYNPLTGGALGVNTTWLTANYHKSLTPGTGLTGTAYNGTAAQTWTIDDAYLATQIATHRPRYYNIVYSGSGVRSYNAANKIDFFPIDAEVKSVPNGDIAYWYSTINGTTESAYAAHPKRDMGARTWVQCPDLTWADARTWIPYLHELFTSIGSQLVYFTGSPTPQIGGAVTQIDTQAQLQDGTSVGSIWTPTNTKLNPTMLLLDMTAAQKTQLNNPLWQPPVVVPSNTKIAFDYTAITTAAQLSVGTYNPTKIAIAADGSFSAVGTNSGTIVYCTQPLELQVGQMVFISFDFTAETPPPSATYQVYIGIRSYPTIPPWTASSGTPIAQPVKAMQSATVYSTTSGRVGFAVGQSGTRTGYLIYKATTAATGYLTFETWGFGDGNKVSNIRIWTW